MTTRAVAGRSEESIQRMHAVIERFRTASREAFLAQYGSAATVAYDGSGDKAAEALIDLFTLEKAAYEVAYEIANRPPWLIVPLRGLAEITQRLTKTEEG